MLVITVVPLLAAIIGLLMYVLASNAKVSEVGRIVFMTAILVVWFTMAGKTIRIG
jgi:hypothetical protein